MKKLLLSGLGLAGACAACCAVPLLVPVVSGLSVAALAAPGGLAFAPESATMAALAGGAAGVAVALVLWRARRRSSAKACAAAPAPSASQAGSPRSGAACGCSGACKAPATGASGTA